MTICTLSLVLAALMLKSYIPWDTTPRHQQKRPSRHLSYILLLFFVLGILYAYLRYHPPLDPDRYANIIRRPLVVEGTLISIPRKTQSGFKQTILIKTIYTPAETPTFDGSLMRDPINVFYTGPPLRPGTTISAPMRVKLSTTTMNPGSYVFEPQLNAIIQDAQAITVQHPKSELSLTDGLLFFEALRYTTTNTMQDVFDNNVSGFLRSITIGDTSGLTDGVNEAFRRTGLSHLLSISGTHFGMLFTLVFVVLRTLLHSLPVKVLLKMTLYVTTSEVAAICTLPVIGLYLLVSGLSVPALRSFIMTGVFLLGLLLGRKGQWVNTILFAAFVVALVQPEAILTVSFQLSFGAVFFIGLVVHRPGNNESDTADKSANQPVPTVAGRLLTTLRESLLVSVAASIGTMPIVMYYFYSFSVVTVLANMLVVPYTGFVIMPLVLCSSVVFALSGRFILVDIINRTTLIMLEFIGAMADLPFASISVGAFAPVFLVLIYLSVFLCYRIRDKRIACVPMLTVAALLAGQFVFTARGEMQVAFIDVGDGDAAVVETPAGRVVVIDTGRTGREVEGYLRHRGKGEIDAIVLSHGDNDHAGGFFRLLDKFKVHRVFDNGHVRYDYDGVIDVRHLLRGDIFTIDGVSFKVLHPYDDTAATVNDASLVLKVSGRYASFLFTGDVQRRGEEDLLAVGGALRADVLKVPHHGSISSASIKFLQLVAPKVSIISVGRDNQYGMPHQDVIARLRGTMLYRTDRDGAILIRETRQGLRVNTYANCNLKKVSSLKDEPDNLRYLFAVCQAHPP
ncbi:DNA internalization-related competence protein ComEC/Rec2 [Candidatus Magnetobacterium casense]|uniref:DNA internalization-related competence protein ComEC/Rec2 n=1 Tax=Candidatus Magnetobacterium casense TaxID=1455061 RepID=UPI0022867E23|nr:DNA internalization-related competence protein ComEC/Rec2 [Candidatus Magnetobacterium casensis]